MGRRDKVDMTEVFNVRCTSLTLAWHQLFDSAFYDIIRPITEDAEMDLKRLSNADLNTYLRQYNVPRAWNLTKLRDEAGEIESFPW